MCVCYGGGQTREDMECLKEEGGLKMGEFHAELRPYEISGVSGDRLRGERSRVTLQENLITCSHCKQHDQQTRLYIPLLVTTNTMK